ncbi:GapR family DNA-binding domain-containing protein, partial [Methylorubrum rhodesianum]|uniref:GapR family DNA-binding domain-containing protein n=1 Tax=Methylorubrum rhodesianum TaxID=29427 RepID=UPI003CFF67E7
MTDMTDTVGVAGDRIRSIIERIERLEEEIKDLMETKKEIDTVGEVSVAGLWSVEKVSSPEAAHVAPFATSA